MAYFSIHDEMGNEWQLQIHLKHRGRMESVAETDTSDAIHTSWLKRVGEIALEYEGVEELGYDTNSLAEMAASFMKQGVINSTMGSDEAGAIVAQAVVQA